MAQLPSDWKKLAPRLTRHGANRNYKRRCQVTHVRFRYYSGQTEKKEWIVRVLEVTDMAKESDEWSDKRR